MTEEEEKQEQERALEIAHRIVRQIVDQTSGGGGMLQ